MRDDLNKYEVRTVDWRGSKRSSIPTISQDWSLLAALRRREEMEAREAERAGSLRERLIGLVRALGRPKIPLLPGKAVPAPVHDTRAPLPARLQA